MWNNPAEIATYLKEKESSHEIRLPSDKGYVVRLDGHRFSVLTKSLNKPIDFLFKNVMINTACDIVREFNPLCAYVQSDEITLVFDEGLVNEHGERQPHSYNGRVLKMCSLYASYASVRFNYHISNAIPKKMWEGFFDARVYSADTEEGALSVYWRFKYDCYRNGVMSLAQTQFSQKKLNGKKLSDVINMVNLDDVDRHLLYGTLVKKKQITRTGLNPKTGDSETVTRTNIIAVSAEPYKYASKEEFTQLIYSKYLS